MIYPHRIRVVYNSVDENDVVTELVAGEFQCLVVPDTGVRDGNERFWETSLVRWTVLAPKSALPVVREGFRPAFGSFRVLPIGFNPFGRDDTETGGKQTTLGKAAPDVMKLVGLRIGFTGLQLTLEKDTAELAG